MAEMESVLAALRAVAEPTRFRLLALCAQSELTVSELAHILGQSQPRVSRHLKLLCNAGLLVRLREGTWVFYRMSQDGAGGHLATALTALVPPADPTIHLDAERLEAVVAARREAAARYFRENAAQWDEVRALYVDEAEVERELLALLPGGPIRDLLDIGTGTGRMLELFGPRAERAVGIDLSREMLAVARDGLARAKRRNCLVRRADMYQIPWASGSFDVVTIHQVLHFADDPAAAIAEAARVVRPAGLLIAVDFAPHDLEYLRTAHAHRRLGFGDEQVHRWLAAAGLTPGRPVHLRGDPLTVSIWPATRPVASEAGASPAPQTAAEATA